MDTPNKSGVTHRQSLEKSKKFFLKQGKTEAELDKQFADLRDVEIPTGFEYLIEVYEDLAMSRSYGAMGGPLPFTFLEIKAYCDLTGVELTPFDLETVKQLDVIGITEWNKMHNAEQVNTK